MTKLLISLPVRWMTVVAGGVHGAQRLGRDAGRKRIAHRRIDVVGALAGGFDHDVRGIVDHIGVVAAQPSQRVGVTSTVENVAASIADHGVDEVVAGQIDGRRCGSIGGLQGLHRHVHAQRVGRRYARNSVPWPAASTMVSPISRRRRIIAAEAAQGICAAVAVEEVVGGVAFEGISEFVASEVDHRRGAAAEGREQLHFHSGSEGIADRRGARSLVPCPAPSMITSPALSTVKKSLPAPPSMVSAPMPPSRMSSLFWPRSVLFPAPLVSVSFPFPPRTSPLSVPLAPL